MGRPVLSKIARPLLRISVLLLTANRFAMPQLPSQLQQLTDELPRCSVLHVELDRGVYGDGIEKPYMAIMREVGVRRALLEVHAVLHGKRPRDIRVVRRLYFHDFDGPNSQVLDEVALKAIEASGLPAELDSIARTQVLAAPIFKGPAGHFGSGKRVSSFVEFFANAWLPQEKPLLFPSSWSTAPLVGTVTNADASGTEALLRSGRFSKRELDRALFDAVLSRYDNSAVIKLLLGAGADVNAHTSDGTTPLMNAVPHPCNLRALLDGGADLNARDKWGRTALQLAREVKEGTAIRLLEEAGHKAKSAVGS